MSFVIDIPVRFSCTFTGGPPTTVTLVVRDPSGTIARYTGAELTHPSTYVWEIILVPASVGVWTRVWVATGSGIDRWRSNELEFLVVGNTQLR